MKKIYLTLVAAVSISTVAVSQEVTEIIKKGTSSGLVQLNSSLNSNAAKSATTGLITDTLNYFLNKMQQHH